MNKINPLYIIGFFIVLSLFVYYKTSQKKYELTQLQENYKTTKELALKLHALKKAYSPQNKKILSRILKSSILQSTNLKVKDSKTKTKITAKMINKSALNYLMNRIFNSTFNITKIDIRRVDNTHANLDMEISW
jgi:hypothetical protein